MVCRTGIDDRGAVAGDTDVRAVGTDGATGVRAGSETHPAHTSASATASRRVRLTAT